MAINFLKVRTGLTLKPNAAPGTPENGDLWYDSGTNLFSFYQNGSVITIPASSSSYRAGQQAVLQTYTFTVTSANATVGATYTNNTQTFTVIGTIAAGTTLVCNGTGAPAASGTLTKATGTGDATITFSTSTNAASTSQVINFSSTLGTTNYAPTIAWRNTTDASPQFQPYEITAKSATGFTVTWNAPIDSLNYVLEYTAFPNV